ncbi:CapA family protein [Candidatus Dojkabacteria bacterium]|jgi:poly-gamma-glutamate synthesis protein (capsule biosynthesis protein)|nr:CapA family protein [Candidatus Dojkabacteria bacterium]
MPIIHNFTDRERKKINVKAIAIVLVLIGILVVTYFVSKNSIKIIPEIEEESNIQNICIDPKLPQTVKDDLEDYVGKNTLSLQISQTDCDIEIVRNPKDTNPYNLIFTKIYIPVSSVLSTSLDLPSDNVVGALNSQKITDYTIIWEKETDDFLKSKYDLAVGQTVYTQKEIEKKIAKSKSYIAIIPFEKLKTYEKEVKVNGNSIFDKTFVPLAYFLTDTVWTKAQGQVKIDIDAIIKKDLGDINYKQEDITTVITSGSSYVGSDRYQSLIADKKDSSYMVSNIKELTKAADIFHMSNEVSVSGRCYQKTNSSYLCSNRSDISVIKILGTDVVGLTGNHILDFGLASFHETLTWYTKNNIQYFGGGVNSKDSHTPRVVTKNGIKFAFIGFNFIPPYSYYSTSTKAGNNNVSLNIMKNDISKAKKIADVIIVDMQFGNEQDTKPDKNTKENARYAIAQGAEIVLGVNGYIPQGFEIANNKGIFYSLGGFINAKATKGMLVKHIFYGKKYIGFELLPLSFSSNLTIGLAEGSIKDTMTSTVFNKSTINYEN